MPQRNSPTILSCTQKECAALLRVQVLEKEVGIWYGLYQTEKQLRLAAEDRAEQRSRRIKREEDRSERLRETVDHESRRLRDLKRSSATALKEKNLEIRTLKRKVEELDGEIRLLRSKRFGKSTEKYGQATGKGPKKKEKRKRGQQPGFKGHGRQDHSHLPERIETLDLPESDKKCSTCGFAKIPLASTEDSEQIEIHVKAHRRVMKRRKYLRGCKCCGEKLVTTAPLPAKLIPKSPYGASVWAQALLEKYLFQRPVHKFIEVMRTQGLNLPQGTLTGGFKRLSPLFDPIIAEIIKRSRTETHWHADETGWRVFEEVEGKASQKWWLWVFRTRSTSVFILDPTRSAKVPGAMLGDEASGILSADRFSSYKAMTADGRFRVAYCWAHVRRDFVELIPQNCHRKWAIDWIDRIALIYNLNDQRVDALNAGNMLAFQIANQTLAYQLCLFALCFTVQAMATDVYSKKQLEILRSLESHWNGLTIFHEYPEVPMDNNQAERELRGLVVGRKCYYGSGSVWSGELAAKLYSIFRTLNIWRINPQAWLTSYLDACAKAGGNAPDAAHLFLPWNMDAARKRELGIGARDSIEFPTLTG